ncbi:MAG: hypothetical protein H0X62_01345 [Bacteroidetes bacterium]|nr:hypothetical protein [Bacteroidota bacterium]
MLTPRELPHPLPDSFLIGIRSAQNPMAQLCPDPSYPSSGLIHWHIGTSKSNAYT